EHCVQQGGRLSAIGRRDRVPSTLRQAIADSEAATAAGLRLHLRLAIDYSAREAIFHAACRFYKVTELSPESFSRVLAEVYRGGSTEVDLLIRTGGEQRLSDFLLWECAFAEFVVVLLFLGTIFLLGTALLVLFCGAVRRSAFFAKLGAGAVATIASGYFLLLSGVSLASSEETLPPDGWKYFCEIDCHIAYSLTRAQTAGALGPEMQQMSAKGKFVLLRV